MAEIREEWLRRRLEQPIDAEQSICDPHHHLWDHPRSRYLLEELHADTGAGHDVATTVFVECGSAYREDGPESLRPVGETELVRTLADESDARGGARIAGIVGFADLTLGSEIDAVLEAHVEAGAGLFRGIRHAAGWDPSEDIRNSHTDPPPQLLLDHSFRLGFSRLAAHDLVFDAWLYHHQIDELTDLAAAFPETPIVLDHVGGPLGIGRYRDRRREVYREWRGRIRELARRENVVIKLGGLAMPINGFGWHHREEPPSSEELAEATAPFLLETIELFGPERAMFESNFPVDKVSASYTVIWNSFQRLTASFSGDERDALFRGTAERVYRIDR